MSAIAKERTEIRKKEFKQGIDGDLSRRKRDDEAIQIRKNKRSEKIAKRRKASHKNIFNNSANNSAVNTNENTNTIIDSNKINDIYSNNPEIVLMGLIYIRKLLSNPTKPPIDQVIQTGVVPKLVKYLSYINYPDHQYEATWALTNIISGDSNIARQIIDKTPLIEYMLELMKSSDRKIQTQAIWCIANILGESKKYIDIILQNRGLEMLLVILDLEISSEKRDIETIQTHVWALANLIRDTSLPFVKVKKALPLIFKVYQKCSDHEVLSDISLALSYISRTANDLELPIVCGMNIISPKWLTLLKMKSSISSPVLRTCGNLIAGTDEVTQMLLDMGFLSYVPQLLSSSDKKEVCWIISNITAGNKKQIQMVINANIVPMIIMLMDTVKWEVKKECMYVIVNLISGGTTEQIDYAVDCGCIDSLCNLLSSKDITVVKNVLKSIERILKFGIKNNQYEKYCDIVEEVGGLDEIECLQSHNDEKIYHMSVKILENHFGEI